MTETEQLSFVELSGRAMAALLDGDLTGAHAETGVVLGDYFTTDRAMWLWRLRCSQLKADPAGAPWIERLLAVRADGTVVGHGGFHGPPDDAGMVELGYAVIPEWRRRGYARAILTELLRRAVAAPDARTVRATISPDNAASLATIAGFGFTEVGEQIDEIDGLEIIYEVPAR